MNRAGHLGPEISRATTRTSSNTTKTKSGPLGVHHDSPSVPTARRTYVLSREHARQGHTGASRAVWNSWTISSQAGHWRASGCLPSSAGHRQVLLTNPQGKLLAGVPVQEHWALFAYHIKYQESVVTSFFCQPYLA